MASTIDSTLDGDLTTTGQSVRKSELKQQFDAAATDIEALQDGTALATDAVDTANIQDDAVTYAKMQDVSQTNVLLGRDTAGAGIVEEISVANTLSMLSVESGADVTDETNVVSSLDGATLTSVTVANDDKIIIQDTSNSDNIKTVVASSLLAGPYVKIAANKTLVEADDCGFASVSASAGSRTITLPLKATLSQGWSYTVFLHIDPGTNNVTVNLDATDGGTEFWTGVEMNDFIDIVYNGNNFNAVREYSGHYCNVYVDTNESIAASTPEHVLNISETTDVGGIWNTTNDEVDVPFDCWADINWVTYGLGINGAIKADAAYLLDVSTLADDNKKTTAVSGRFSVDSGAKIELWALNADTTSAQNIEAGSRATIKLTRRR